MSGTAARPITVTSRTRKFSQYLLDNVHVRDRDVKKLTTGNCSGHYVIR